LDRGAEAVACDTPTAPFKKGCRAENQQGDSGEHRDRLKREQRQTCCNRREQRRGEAVAWQAFAKGAGSARVASHVRLKVQHADGGGAAENMCGKGGAAGWKQTCAKKFAKEQPLC
jgi:hypothetical protein